jgi:FdhD protein
MTPDVEKGIISVTTKNKEDPVEDLRHTRFLVPGCFDSGVFSKASDAILSQKIESEVRLEAERIVKIVQQVQSASILYRSTGGVHGAALCTPEELLFFSEDIGRHNAIDKVVGRCLLSDIPTEDKIIVTSGRISSAVLLKIVKSAIPVLISRSAPTTEAVRFADKFGITLIGFVRGKRFNIYSHDWRVLT